MILVDLLGQTLLFVLEVDNYTFLLFKNDEGLLEVPLTHLQDFFELVLGLRYSNNLLLCRIFFDFFFFLPFFLVLTCS